MQESEPSDSQHPYKANVFQGVELRGWRSGTPKSGDLASGAGVRAE